MSEEQVVIVDEENQVTGSAPRSVMRRDGLCHRATFIFVFDSEGYLYIQKRTLTKDVYPGYFDLAAGGVVAEGEDYDTAAARELSEELGISDVPLSPRFHFYYHSDECRLWGKVFTCVYDGLLTLQEEEVAGVIREKPEAVLAEPEKYPYTPDTLVALERLIHLENEENTSEQE